MMTGMVHLHSILRWVVLILLIWAIVKGLSGWIGNKKFSPRDRKPFLFAMISIHIQLVIGLGLYFSGPWKKVIEAGALTPENLEKFERFWKMEHVGMMVLAAVLVTIGHAKVKKATADKAKFKSGAIFFIIAILIIFMAIPWPFLGEPVARGLFPRY